MTLPSVHLVGHSSSEAGYIKDGLVFWLDGIDKGGEDGKWVDKVGGVEFTPNGKVEWGTDYVRGVLSAAAPVGYPVASSTIEFVLKNVSQLTTNTLWFNCGKIGCICGGVAGGVLLIVQGGMNGDVSYRDKSLNTPGIHSISANNTIMLHNLAPNYNTQSLDYWTLKNPFAVVGTNKNLQQFHSIRIYDRLLSEAEMRHNQEVDRRRFKLTFPEPIMTLEYEEDDYEGDCEGEELREGYGVEG